MQQRIHFGILEKIIFATRNNNTKVRFRSRRLKRIFDHHSGPSTHSRRNQYSTARYLNIHIRSAKYNSKFIWETFSHPIATARQHYSPRNERFEKEKKYLSTNISCWSLSRMMSTKCSFLKIECQIKED